MKSGRGIPPLLTTRSWILRSICRMLSTSVRTLSHSFSTCRAEKRICISSACTFFCSSRYLGALWPSFSAPRASARRACGSCANRASAATFSRSRFSAAMAPASPSSSLASTSSSTSSSASSASLKSIRPSTRSSILNSSFSILAGEIEDLRDRHRARRDRHDHVLQAFLDPLGDLDLAFAGEELDRAHFAHVHAHRVGRAAEFGVERRDRGLGGLLDVLGRRGGRGVRHQQRFGVRGLVVDLDPHVADHADDALDLLGVEHVVGQVVVDLGEREEAALLAEHDQRLQAPLARLDVGRRQHARRDLGVPAVAALLAGGVLGALAGDLRGDLAGGRLVARRRRRRRACAAAPLTGLSGRRDEPACDDRLGGLAGDGLAGLPAALAAWRRPWRLRAGFGSGLPAFGLPRASRATFFLAAGFAVFALPTAFFAGRTRGTFRPRTRRLLSRDGRAVAFGAAFLARACAPSRSPASSPRACADFGLAGDLRAGFAGFLAMVILRIRVPIAPTGGGDRENLKLYHLVSRAHRRDRARFANARRRSPVRSGHAARSRRRSISRAGAPRAHHFELTQPFRLLGGRGQPASGAPGRPARCACCQYRATPAFRCSAACSAVIPWSSAVASADGKHRRRAASLRNAA